MINKAKKKKIEKGKVPLSAMIDVVFLLLIYFVYTYSSTPEEAHIAINLPTNETTPEPTQDRFEVWIMPGAHGYILNQTHQRNNLDTFRNDFKEYLSIHTADEMTVNIKVHRNTRQAKLVEFLDLCAEYNISKLNVNMLNPLTDGGDLE